MIGTSLSSFQVHFDRLGAVALNSNSAEAASHPPEGLGTCTEGEVDQGVGQNMARRDALNSLNLPQRERIVEQVPKKAP